MPKIRKNLHEKIAADVGRQILTGEYCEGALLPTETTLTEKYGVSRTVVREAFRTLAAKGLTLSRPKVGTRVRQQSEWNMMDHDVLAWIMIDNRNQRLFRMFMECRRGIEPQAAALAAMRGSSLEFEALASTIDELQHVGNDAGRFRMVINQFHKLVLAASRNALMLSFAAVVEAATALGLPYQADVFAPIGAGGVLGANSPLRDLIDMYRRVYEAISTRDSSSAHDWMTRLLDWLVAFEWEPAVLPVPQLAGSPLSGPVRAITLG